ncbi:hypothetical protein P1X14_13135 [Sphingomonas sp. AOB5]|uniref:2'-5' RNA ligase family protein n=1 Tax=Sphingomonas sp. AOB5 TaxID=3034017 RepID=UPI0023F79CB8|nr:hypothetical protein [Sphingomonas sp. AOB5]MDF7776196.1 hypothetical protein [Sphingomonas sp. AOB5]
MISIDHLLDKWSAHDGPLPAYLFFKPSVAIATEMEQTRRMLGIISNYGANRFHSTIALIGDLRALTRDDLARLGEAIRLLDARPFDVVLDHVRGRELRGSDMKAYRSFRHALAAAFARVGLSGPIKKGTPHVSLTYGVAPDGFRSIAPIRWPVDELLFAVSIHGKGRHEPIANWQLVPRQGSLDF